MNKTRRWKAKAKRAFVKKFRDFMSLRGVSLKKARFDAIGARVAVRVIGIDEGAGSSPVDSSIRTINA